MSMSDQREHVDAPLTLERMRQDVAERLGMPPERVATTTICCVSA